MNTSDIIKIIGDTDCKKVYDLIVKEKDSNERVKCLRLLINSYSFLREDFRVSPIYNEIVEALRLEHRNVTKVLEETNIQIRYVYEKKEEKLEELGIKEMEEMNNRTVIYQIFFEAEMDEHLLSKFYRNDLYKKYGRYVFRKFLNEFVDFMRDKVEMRIIAKRIMQSKESCIDLILNVIN